MLKVARSHELSRSVNFSRVACQQQQSTCDQCMHLETVPVGRPVVLGSGLLACLAIEEVHKTGGQDNGVIGAQPYHLATEEGTRLTSFAT